MRSQCRIVLVGTSHPANIGAAARAMKTMALDDLHLVTPQCEVDSQAIAMAAHADDLLASAQVQESLPMALTDATLVLGLTARPRREGVPALTPKEAAMLVKAESGPTAVVFGRERTGLTNEELGVCQRLVHIPANPAYPALNLAAAVQIMAYELFCADQAGESLVQDPLFEEPHPMATGKHLEALHDLFERLVMMAQISGDQSQERLKLRLRAYINRTRPTVAEADMLHGLLKRFVILKGQSDE